MTALDKLNHITHFKLYVAESLELGSSPRSRRYLDRWQDVIIIPDPTTQIGYHGYVTEWSIYSERKVNGRRKEKVLHSLKLFFDIQ